MDNERKMHKHETHVHEEHKRPKDIHATHTDHEMQLRPSYYDGKRFQTKVLDSAIITIPVLLLSPTIQKWLHLQALTFPGSKYILFGLSTIIVVWGALPFYKGAIKAIRSGILDMMVLVSLAVLSGYFFSVAATFFLEAMDFYWEISTLTVFLLFVSLDGDEGSKNCRWCA